MENIKEIYKLNIEKNIKCLDKRCKSMYNELN